MNEAKDAIRLACLDWMDSNSITFRDLGLLTVPQLIEKYGLNVCGETLRMTVSLKSRNRITNINTIKKLLTFFNIPYVERFGGIELVKP